MGLRSRAQCVVTVVLALTAVAAGCGGSDLKLTAPPALTVRFASVAAGVTAAVDQRSCARLRTVPGLAFAAGAFASPCQVLAALETMRPESNRQLGTIGLLSGLPAVGGPPRGARRAADFHAIFTTRPDGRWILAFPPQPSPLAALPAASARAQAQKFVAGIRSHDCNQFYASLNTLSPNLFASNGRPQTKQQLCSQEPFVGATRVLLANGPEPRITDLGGVGATRFVGVAAAHGYLTLIVGRVFPSTAAPGGGGSLGHPPPGPPPGAPTRPPAPSAPGVIGFVRNA